VWQAEGLEDGLTSGEVRGTGHAFMLQRPQEVADALDRFIESL